MLFLHCCHGYFCACAFWRPIYGWFKSMQLGWQISKAYNLAFKILKSSRDHEVEEKANRCPIRATREGIENDVRGPHTNQRHLSILLSNCQRCKYICHFIHKIQSHNFSIFKEAHAKKKKEKEKHAVNGCQLYKDPQENSINSVLQNPTLLSLNTLIELLP